MLVSLLPLYFTLDLFLDNQYFPNLVTDFNHHCQNQESTLQIKRKLSNVKIFHLKIDPSLFKTLLKISTSFWAVKRYFSGLKNKHDKMKYILLSNGSELPIVGLGTWKTDPEEIENVVEIALENGYRHFDTAFNYNTEEPVGKVVNRWIASERIRRDELFITTKLPVWGNRPGDVEKYLKLSLSRLNLDYVDLYLMHMPFSFHSNKDNTAPLLKEDGTFSLDNESEITATWKQMEKQVKNGLAKGIGMSNFNEQQIKTIYNSAEIKPVVLQVELHAYLQQKELRKACKQMEIAVTAFAPLGSPGANQHFTKKYNFALDNFPDILGLPVVQELSKKYNKTPGQILLKHLVQQNISVIPKSSNSERLKANIDLFNFELISEDIQQLDELDREESGRIFNFLFFKGVEKHPEYPFK